MGLTTKHTKDTKMKIIKSGNTNCAIWWEGMNLSCPNCGRIVQLERNDDNLAEWTWCEANRVAVYCPNCREVTMKAIRP